MATSPVIIPPSPSTPPARPAAPPTAAAPTPAPTATPTTPTPVAPPNPVERATLSPDALNHNGNDTSGISALMTGLNDVYGLNQPPHNGNSAAPTHAGPHEGAPSHGAGEPTGHEGAHEAGHEGAHEAGHEGHEGHDPNEALTHSAHSAKEAVDTTKEAIEASKEASAASHLPKGPTLPPTGANAAADLLKNGAGKVLPLASGVFSAQQTVEGLKNGIQAKDGGEAAVAATQTVSGGLNTAAAAATLTGAEVAGPLGGVAMAADGVNTLANGIKNHDTEQEVVGGVKTAGGAAFTAGLMTANPVLAAGGALAYGGAVIYENREAIANEGKKIWHSINPFD